MFASLWSGSLPFAILWFLQLRFSTAEFNDFRLLGNTSIEKPAFLMFVVQEQSSAGLDLSVTQFGQTIEGQISFVRNISESFGASSATDLSALSTDVVGKNFLWPNDATVVPDAALSEEKRSAICGATKDPCTVLAVPDGFLTPGHQTGSIYLQSIAAPNQSPSDAIKIAVEETFWYYHRVQWVDMDNDGLLDIIAARAFTNNVGMSKGELVWLRQPSSVEDFFQPWKLTVLTEGPDVIIFVDESIEDYVYVYAPEFFGSRLSLTIIEKAENPKVVSFTVLDDSIGAGYDAMLGDVDGDGARELIISTHEGGSGGFIYAYEFPATIDDYTTAAWDRHTIAQGFTVQKRGLNQAAPGFISQFYFDGTAVCIKSDSAITSTDCINAGRPWFLVAGDGSESLHIVYPIDSVDGDAFAYQMDTIVDIGGTVGNVAVASTAGMSSASGGLMAAVPDYDHDILYLYAFFLNK